MNKTICILALTVALSTGCSMRNMNTATLAVSTAGLVCDWMDTIEIATNPKLREANPILGEKPSKGFVSAYFATTILLNAALWSILPENYKSIVPMGVTGVQTYAIVHNAPATGWCGVK